ncbi:reverse transcriptase domain-containing protein [Tanacetum coccineum]|uniref:Reverse transcriptase domain-containing protein n=1 Tax=Tanacetum coccineum TaxID=301880 RepID=A0ABQ5FQB0_9ASTR
MADNRTMAQLLQTPIEGYEDAIVIPEINANFELKHGLINLDKMPRECLKIIESKSKVRNSRNKAVIAKVSSNSSTPGISPDVAALTTEVYELKNMMKTMLIEKQKSQAPAPVKEVEQSCVTCRANFNQGNTNSRSLMAANQIRPPGFPLIQNNQNRFNHNQGNRFNQNRGTNFNQNHVYQPPTSQPPVYQAQPYQAPTQQVQGVSKTDFENYVKANDAVLRNMQNQGQGLQNQIANLTYMLSKFINANTDSSSGTGTLPSNTVTNPKEDLKGITTRSGIAYKGPTIPTTSSPKVVERETEVTKETMPPANNGSTEDVQPLVVPVFHHESISEPVNGPVNLSFEISFTDALMLMPKFASTLKTLIGNKEKLSEMARTPLNENCSAVILNKLPKKLGDPGRFLIPCEFSGINTCNALADLGASINLMPYSVWKNLSLLELTPTCMTLELADRSISEPIVTFLFSEEADSFLALEDDPTSPEVDPIYYDPEGDILLLEAILNSEPSPPLQRNYFPETQKDLKICEANNEKSFVDEPPEVELKDLPPHLEYAFLEGDDKLPVIIAKDLKK